MQRRATIVKILVATSFATCGAGTGRAQNGADMQPAPTELTALAESGEGVAEIVVTARKRAENIQDVPVTITAFSAEAIEKSDTKTIYDLATRTPGLYFGTTGGRNGGNKLQIRNLSTGTSGGSKASAFIDGVYVSGDYSSTALANLERIEVLKGPQSAYFGRSTFVGAVNFVTRDPGDDFEGKIDAIAATLGEYDVSGYITTPIIGETLSNTISARYFEFRGPDAWVNFDGYHLGDQKTFAITNKLVFRPADWLTVRWYGSYVRDRDHIPQTSYFPLSTRNSVIRRPDGTQSHYYEGSINIDHSRANAPLLYRQFIRGYIEEPGVSRKQYRSVLSFDADVAGHSLSGFAAYGDERLANGFDAFYLGARIEPAPDARGVIRNYTYNSSNFVFLQRSKDQQYELRLASPQDQRFRYLFGYNYTKLYGGTSGFFNPIRPSGAPVNPAPVLSTNNINWVGGNPAETNSVFGGVFFDPVPEMTVSVELRRQWETIRAALMPTAFSTTTSRFEAEFKSWLPRFNIQYRASDDLQFYGVVSRGNNPGGFNTNVPTAFLPAGVPQAYGEERLDNYELGVKSTWLDGRLLFNAAIYHMIWKNQQVLQSYVTNFPSPGAVSALFTADARSEVTGFEVEVEGIPLDGLNLRATAAYGKAKYRDFCSSNYYALTGVATALGCRSVAGFQQEGTPALQLSFLVDYTRPIGRDLDAFVRADYQYQSRVYIEEWNASWMGPANLAGLRLGVRNNRWTAEVFSRNLLNDDHSPRVTRATYQPVGGNGVLAPGEPGPNGTYPPVVTPFGTTPAGAAGNQSVADTARRPRQFGVRLGYRF